MVEPLQPHARLVLRNMSICYSKVILLVVQPVILTLYFAQSVATYVDNILHTKLAHNGTQVVVGVRKLCMYKEIVKV